MGKRQRIRHTNQVIRSVSGLDTVKCRIVKSYLSKEIILVSVKIFVISSSD